MPELGFCSYESVATALKAQHRFFIDQFISLIKDLKSRLYLDPRYILAKYAETYMQPLSSKKC